MEGGVTRTAKEDDGCDDADAKADTTARGAIYIYVIAQKGYVSGEELGRRTI